MRQEFLKITNEKLFNPYPNSRLELKQLRKLDPFYRKIKQHMSNL